MINLPDDAAIRRAYADEGPVLRDHWHPQAGDVVLDIGSAVGLYAVPALQAGATVIAVDPDLVATRTLWQVAGLNAVGDKLTTVSAAVFDAPAYPPDLRHALMASEYWYLIPPEGTLFVTMDALVAEQGLQRLDWVKIDVEGAELGVLRGGMETLQRFHPRLLIEDHTLVYPFVAEMGSRQSCLDLLHGLGYTVTEVPYEPPPRTYMVAS